MEPDTHPLERDADDGDRRAEPRRASRIDAQLEHPGGTLHGLVVDISFGGAKFVTQTVTPGVAIGRKVTLTLVPGVAEHPEQLCWTGAVVRSERSGDDGPSRIAYAIAFDS